jgi:hypothetical protein
MKITYMILILLVLIPSNAQAETKWNGTSTVSGRIFEKETGKGIPNAEVVISNDDKGGFQTTRSDQNGYYEFPKLIAGNFRIEYNEVPLYSNRDRSTDRKNLNLKSGTHLQHIDFPIFVGQSISGKVVDQNGSPIENVRVSISDAGNSDRSQTDVNGNFVLRGLHPGSHSPRASHEDYKSERRSKITAATNDLVFVLEKLRTVTGKLVYPETQEAITRFKIAEGAGGIKALAYAQEFKDPNGEFKVKPPSTGAYSLYIQVPGHGAIIYPVFTNESTDTQVELTIEVPKGVTIHGTVNNTNGEPVKNAELLVMPTNNGDFPPPYVAKTDQSGRFAIADIAPQKFTLWARADNEVETAHEFDVTREGSHEYTITLGAPTSLNGQLSINGIPLPDVSVAIFGSIQLNRSSLHYNQNTVTDENGKYFITGMPEGEFRGQMEITKNDITYTRRIYMDIPANAGITRDVDFQDDNVTLRGRIHFPDNEQHTKAHARVDFYRDGLTESRRVESNNQGTFDLANLPAGQLQLVIYGSKQKSININPLPNQTLEFDIDMFGSIVHAHVPENGENYRYTHPILMYPEYHIPQKIENSDQLEELNNRAAFSARITSSPDQKTKYRTFHMVDPGQYRAIVYKLSTDESNGIITITDSTLIERIIDVNGSDEIAIDFHVTPE